MSMEDDKTRILPDMAKTNAGTQLSGIYELDERIASGGMGEVYRGHNIQTGDHVAIKIVLPEFARDQTILSLFRKEASILNHLSHDAIVRYHVFTIDPGIGRPYLAMEFVNGESLFDVMRRGAMAPEDVRKLCHRLASGLSSVHEAGAVHRDLSPDNVILPGGKVERAKIIDFGIARSATVGGETLIGGRFAGKYNYVSPEQLGLFGGEVSELSDVYSLGLVLAAVLRGKPIEMNGSQFEIVEKRRTVPDLAGIDEGFRPMIEAMLQPDPMDRPTSAEIARMTRDDTPDETGGTLAPRTAALRDRTAAPPQMPKAASLHPWSDTPPEPGFVPHQRPAHLSKPPPGTAQPPRQAAPATPSPVTSGPAAGRRNMAIAALAALVVVAGGGAYLSGFLSFQPEVPAGTQAPRLSPEPSKPPPAGNAGEQAATDVAPSAPAVEKPAAAPAAPRARAELPAPAASRPEVAKEQGEQAAQPPAAVAISKPPAAAAPAPTAAPPPATEAVNRQAQTAAPTPAPEQPGKAAAQPPAAEAPPVSANRPNAVNGGQNTAPPPGDAAAQSRPEPAPSANAADIAKTLSQQFDEQADDARGKTDVVMNLPKPQPPPADVIDGVAERISWLRSYHGGDCFYATATSMTDKAAEIEGFGTAADPFVQMLGAFQAKFRIEPDISVRLIEPAQCEVTGFLSALGNAAAEKPRLTLDRTSVPSGAPISGTLETLGGLRSSLLLIDHKGMVFSLDDRLVVQAGKASFSVPIGLGAADRAADKAVPQIILAITGPSDIDATTFSSPTPASVLLPKILDEIQKKRLAFSATAKYFQLGK